MASTRSSSRRRRRWRSCRAACAALRARARRAHGRRRACRSGADEHRRRPADGAVDSLDEAALAPRSGGLVAFPTETVSALGAHAFDEVRVARIFATKGRPRTDPLIVHVAAAAEAGRSRASARRGSS